MTKPLELHPRLHGVDHTARARPGSCVKPSISIGISSGCRSSIASAPKAGDARRKITPTSCISSSTAEMRARLRSSIISGRSSRPSWSCRRAIWRWPTTPLGAWSRRWNCSSGSVNSKVMASTSANSSSTNHLVRSTSAIPTGIRLRSRAACVRSRDPTWWTRAQPSRRRWNSRIAAAGPTSSSSGGPR